MNPILHKTLALTLSASLLATYGTPAFAWDHTVVSDTQHYTDPAGYNDASYDGNGAAFEITKAGNATFENTTLNNNTITKKNSQGGAIYSKGTVTVGDNVTFNGNTATGNGGAFYSEGSAAFGNGVTFSNNTAYQGGAAYLKNNSYTFGNNLSVLNNKTTGSAAGFDVQYTNLTIGDNATFANNAGTLSGYGGAMRIYGDKTKNWTTSIGNNAQFTGNKTTTKGGAFYVYNALMSIGDNATFANNEAVNAKGTTTGGAIYNSARSFTLGKGATFTNNKAAQGGAIYQAADADLLLEQATFTGNQATGNATQSGGGAIIVDKKDSHAVTINDSAFTENTADVAGGAILQMDGSKATITLNNTSFDKNQAGAEGGAVTSDSTLLVKNSTFTGNKTTSTKIGPNQDITDTDDGGGAIMMYDEANTTVTDSVFKNNESGTFGGAISTRSKASSDKSSLKVDNSIFEGNKSGNRGGAINATVSHTVTNSTFTGNQAGTRGGALFVSDTRAADNERGTIVSEIANSVFENNSAYEGGAIWQNNGTMTIDNTKFLNNKSTWIGAIGQASPAPGPKDAAGKLIINNSEFTGNSAEQWSAGAIGVFSEAEIYNTVFNNNAILSDAPAENLDGGGAIYVGGWGQLTVKNSSFTGNKGNRGGAIASTNQGQGIAEDPVAFIKLDQVTFADNTALEEGGALANYLIGGNGNPNTIKDSTFTGNKAGTKGGAIFNAKKAVLNLEGNNTFADNTASGVANDIYNDGTLNINSGTTTLAGGVAGAGALNVKGSSVLNLGQATAEADSIAFDNGATLAVEFGNDAMGNLKANTITIGENASDSAKLLVTLSRDFLTDTTGISRQLTNGTAVTNGSFAMADASNALYNVTFDNNLVTAVRKTQEETKQEIANAGGNDNNMNVINAFTNSSDMGSDAANQTADVINSLAQTDVSAAVAATNAVAPEAASAKQVVHGSIAREVFNSLQTRMDSAANAAPQAFALDDEQQVQKQGSYSVWMQGLLNKSHKEATDTSAFTGSSTGLAFGADTMVNDDVLLGAGYAYTHTNVSSDGRHDRILGDNFFVYGQYRPSRFYVQASLGYGDSKYEEAKYLPGLNVNADYHVKSYSAQATAGYELTDMFTPTLGLRYINLQQEGYKDSADQAVSAEQNSYLSGVLGLTVKNEVYASSALRLLPQLHAGLSYDFVSDSAQGNVVLPNGSNYSISGERLHRLGFEAGASVSAYLSDNWEALLGYEGNFRQDYNSHTGTLKVRYLF